MITMHIKTKMPEKSPKDHLV